LKNESFFEDPKISIQNLYSNPSAFEHTVFYEIMASYNSHRF